MPSSEAKLNQNRCTKCYDCPICSCTLSTVPVPGAESDASVYLACGFCQWSSLGRDQPASNPVNDKVAQLTDVYQKLAAEEQRAMEVKRASLANPLYHLRGRLGTRTRYAMQQRQTQLHSRSQCAGSCRERGAKVFDQARNDWVDSAPDPVAAVEAPTTKAPPTLPAAAFSAPVALGEVASLAQRHRASTARVDLIKDLRALPKALLAKRSKRCKQCEHNLVKPELSPHSLKFKMQLFALLNVPSIRVVSISALKSLEPGHIVVLVSNPLDQPIEVSFAPVAVDVVAVGGEHVSAEAMSAARPVAVFHNSQVTLPPSAIRINEMEADPADDQEGVSVGTDDAFVVARHRHTVQLRLPVLPGPDLSNVEVAFAMTYAYKPPPAPSLRKDDAAPDALCTPTIPVHLYLGACLPEASA